VKKEEEEDSVGLSRFSALLRTAAAKQPITNLWTEEKLDAISADVPLNLIDPWNGRFNDRQVLRVKVCWFIMARYSPVTPVLVQLRSGYEWIWLVDELLANQRTKLQYFFRNAINKVVECTVISHPSIPHYWLLVRSPAPEIVEST
jgi:hypothetical protein